MVERRGHSRESAGADKDYYGDEDKLEELCRADDADAHRPGSATKSTTATCAWTAAAAIRASTR